MKRVVSYAIFLGFLCLCCTQYAKSQEKTGLVTDNYLPTHQMNVNPALLADQKVWLDVNLFGAHSFVRNNFTYAATSTIPKVFNTGTFYVNTSRDNLNGHSHNMIMGPAASMVFGKNTFALFANIRGNANVDNMPTELVQALADSTYLLSSSAYEFRNMRFKALTWAEVGGSWGRVVKTAGHDMINLGISVKYLRGFGALNAIMSEGSYVDDGTEILRSNGKFGLATLGNSSGWGLGTDLGFVYKKMHENVDGYTPHSRNSGCRTFNYKYRFGVSLIDLGYINYTDGADYGRWTQQIRTSDLESLSNQESELNSLLDDRRNKFSTMLPAAISAQFDYNIYKGLYFNTSVFQSLTPARIMGAERANSAIASVRYEHRWFGVNIPVSLYEYKTPSLGLAFRIGPLNIGTDTFLPWLVKSDVYGGDVYASLHLRLLKSPSCNGKGKNGQKKNGTMSCPAW